MQVLRVAGVLDSPVWTHLEQNRSSFLASDPQSQQAHCGLDLGIGTAARLLQAFWVTAYWPCFSFSNLKYFALVYPEPCPAYYTFWFEE